MTYDVRIKQLQRGPRIRTQIKEYNQGLGTGTSTDVYRTSPR